MAQGAGSPPKVGGVDRGRAKPAIRNLRWPVTNRALKAKIGVASGLTAPGNIPDKTPSRLLARAVSAWRSSLFGGCFGRSGVMGVLWSHCLTANQVWCHCLSRLRQQHAVNQVWCHCLSHRVCTCSCDALAQRSGVESLPPLPRGSRVASNLVWCHCHSARYLQRSLIVVAAAHYGQVIETSGVVSLPRLTGWVKRRIWCGVTATLPFPL